MPSTVTPQFRAYGRKDLDTLQRFKDLGEEKLTAMKAVSAVLPFRINNYVIEELIDWNNVPDDPMYQLTVPQEGMLEDSHLATMIDLVKKELFNCFGKK